MNCIDCAPAPQAHFLSLQKADSERLIRLQIFAVFYINLYFDKGFAFETIAEPIFRPRQQQLSFIIDIAYFVQIGILRAGQLQRSWVTPKPRRQCRQSLYQNGRVWIIVTVQFRRGAIFVGNNLGVLLTLHTIAKSEYRKPSNFREVGSQLRPPIISTVNAVLYGFRILFKPQSLLFYILTLACLSPALLRLPSPPQTHRAGFNHINGFGYL